jgi:hypothetical protein
MIPIRRILLSDKLGCLNLRPQGRQKLRKSIEVRQEIERIRRQSTAVD